MVVLLSVADLTVDSLALEVLLLALVLLLLALVLLLVVLDPVYLPEELALVSLLEEPAPVSSLAPVLSLRHLLAHLE